MNQLLGNNEAVVANHGPSRGPHSLLAIGGQRDIGDSRMASVERPFGLAVADDENAGGCHCKLYARVSFASFESVSGEVYLG